MKIANKERTFLLSALLALPLPSAGQGVNLEIMTGSAFNFPNRLTLRQSGYPDLSFTAHYDTDPLGTGTPYYLLRAGLWEGGEAWEFTMLHHRLFLKDPPPEVQVFAIHYGYTFFLVGKAWKTGDFVLHANGGPILTSPENTVRGMVFYTSGGLLGSGYYLSGFGLTAALSRDIPLGSRLFLVLDTTLSSGWTWDVPIVDGGADVPNLGLHFHIGLGARL